MKILVTGSSGLVGKALVDELARAGHTVCRLLRPESPSGVGATKSVPLRWNPAIGELEGAAAGADAVVNLAGASIAGGRWTAARKKLLATSRVDATRQLVTAVGRLAPPPKVFVSASAVGYYGNRGDEELTEESASGNDFLAGVCRAWEEEAAKAERHGMRVVQLRFGIILAKQGGALQKMLPPFRMGVGGRLASGQQWMSWVTLADVVRVIQFALEGSGMRGATGVAPLRSAVNVAPVRGALNVVAPQPVRNVEFTRALAKALRRPAIFPAPAFALRLALGEMAEALLLSSQRVLPKKLEQAGYTFLHPEIGGALAAILTTR